MKFTPPYPSFCGFIITCLFLTLQASALSVSSPDGTIALELTHTPDLNYRLQVNGEILLIDSPLRLQLDPSITLGEWVEVESVSRQEHDATWSPVVPGRFQSIRDHYRELTVNMKEKSRLAEGKLPTFQLIVRVFDDGVAFRYRVDASDINASAMGVLEESTHFQFASRNYTCWAVDHLTFISSQEHPFVKQTIDDLKTRERIGMPLVVKTDHHYLAITEADLENYAGMFLKSASSSGRVSDSKTVVTRLARKAEELYAVQVQGSQLLTPWRVIMVADSAPALLENNMILNLNDPCAIEDPSWIQPGMMAWDHWWSGEVQMDTDTIKQYIQLAADMGWQYQLIDWQWYGAFDKVDADISTVNPAVDMDEVRRFAAEKGVRLWLWMYWTDVERDDAYLNAMQLFESWGIAGIKIDFMDREDQWMVNWYHKIVKAAADHHLMVDFHGAYKPTGWRRTYPNLMTREGILGNEYNKWSDQVTPEHNATILYTRNLLGEMDFTPGGFLNRTRNTFRKASGTNRPAEVQGTRAHQLALFVCYESPITCICDHPDHIRGADGADFLQQVPTVWEETRGLAGDIGAYAVIAKRSGKQWYIGSITNWDRRDLSLPLDFLGEGSYQLEIWEDGPKADKQATDLSTRSIQVSASDTLSLKLAPGGGAVCILTPIGD